MSLFYNKEMAWCVVVGVPRVLKLRFNSKALWTSKDEINFIIRAISFILCMLYRLGGYFDHYAQEQNDENLHLSTPLGPPQP